MKKKDYVCIHKQVLRSSVFKDPDVYRLFTWILVNCLEEDCKVYIDSNRRKIEIDGSVGDCIFLKSKLSEELGVSRFVIDRCIKSLAKMDVISLPSVKGYTIAKVLNYKQYQTVRLEDFCSDPDVHAWYRDDMPNVRFDPRDCNMPSRLSNAKLGSVWVEWCDFNESNGTPLTRDKAEKQLTHILKNCSVSDAILRITGAMDSLKEEKKEKSGKTRREVSTGISSSDPKYTELFDAFWKVYPRERRGNKTQASKRFRESCDFLVKEGLIECDDREFQIGSHEEAGKFLTARATVYSTSLSGEAQKFFKGAAAWLNGHNFLDSRDSWIRMGGGSGLPEENKFNTWE